AERFEDIRVVIERELHAPLRDVFRSVEQVPTGSASLGQVHRARLKDGRLVAVKVQRPGIYQIVRTDLGTLRFVLAVLRRLFPASNHFMDLPALFREFSRVVYTELDYIREGHNAEHFARIFADEADIVAPCVIWEHTTRRVLTLDWVDGIKITHIQKLDAAGVDRDALARRLAGAYFKQVLEIGFFHADPHPGNIFARPRRYAHRVRGLWHDGHHHPTHALPRARLLCRHRPAGPRTGCAQPAGAWLPGRARRPRGDRASHRPAAGAIQLALAWPAEHG